MSKVRVVCNTSPIIGLVSINRLSLLWQLFDEVILPEAVYNELCADSVHHQAEIEEIRDCVSSGRIKIYQVKNADMVKALYGKLHYGELEVIVGAKELDISLAIIDERAARRMASEFLVDTIGILGILSLAKQRGIINCIKPDLDCLRENGYRIAESLYRQILVKNGESCDRN